MAAVSDVSIEFAHLYLAHLDEEQAELAARAAQRWLNPLIAGYEDAGLTVSTVVMLDDYFAPEGTDIGEKMHLLQEACRASGVRVDHVAHEAACAESIDRLRTHLRQEPRAGDGSSRPPLEDIGSEWLANGDPARGRRREPQAVGLLSLPHVKEVGRQAEGQARARLRPRGHHSIHLDIELWRDEHGADTQVWACPTLSAWWQLIRLGMLRDETSGKPMAPPGTQSRVDAPPLPARRTLTLLDPRFLEVEHAVRVILQRVSLPEAWRRYLREGEHAPDPLEHLERIAYMFMPPGFESRLSTRA